MVCFSLAQRSKWVVFLGQHIQTHQGPSLSRVILISSTHGSQPPVKDGVLAPVRKEEKRRGQASSVLERNPEFVQKTFPHLHSQEFVLAPQLSGETEEMEQQLCVQLKLLPPCGSAFSGYRQYGRTCQKPLLEDSVCLLFLKFLFREREKPLSPTWGR